MKFEIQKEGNYSIMTIKTDKLDTRIAPELKSQFIVLANTSDSGHLILDLSEITFADSSGLGALLLVHRLYRELDQKLILCNVPERIQKLFSISHLDKTFTIVSDIETAVSLLSEDE